jgi:hypothetical protein
LKLSKSTSTWVVAILFSLGAAGQLSAQLSPLLDLSALGKALENPETAVITSPWLYQAESDQAMSPLSLNEDWVWGAIVPSLGRASPPLSDTELSKESENPVTRMITLPLRYEAEFNDGPTKRVKDTFEIDQAVLPFMLNNDWALITRTKFPAVSQPPKKLREDWESGLGNGYTTFFLSPEHGTSFFWGAGPVLYYPSATNKALGVNKWGSGPSVAFLKKDAGPWVWGVVVNNIWSFGGPPNSSDRTDSLLLNPVISYHFSNGWSVGSSPNITANWLSKNGHKWTVPIGGGIQKVFRLGGQHMKLSVDAYYNAIRAEAGNDTSLVEVTLTLLFPRD